MFRLYIRHIGILFHKDKDLLPDIEPFTLR